MNASPFLKKYELCLIDELEQKNQDEYATQLVYYMAYLLISSFKSMKLYDRSIYFH